jgi:nucleotide-binding universal stress UspA family protein
MNDRILVPLDGSARAEQILVQVARLLRREDAQVILLGVVDLSYSMIPDDGAARRKEMEAYLASRADTLARQGVRVRWRLAEGIPASEIARAEEEEKATLIAISTHGRSGLARWLLGSVAEKVLRSASAPVLLTRSFQKGPQGVPLPAGPGELPFRRLLVPVDGSDASLQVVPTAAAFARLFGSEIDVLCVEEPPLPPWGIEIPPVPRQPPGPGAATVAAAKRAVERLRAYDVPAVPDALPAVGDPSALILSKAEERGSDLIVMATHGRSGVARWALGSVAERVLRHGTLPMLIVRART